MSFLPTLNEFVNENDGSSLHKSIIDDVCEFPEGKERFGLRLQAIQRLDDIVMFHRFVMVTHKTNQQVIEPGFEAFNEHYQGMFDKIFDDNPEQVATARMAFNAYDIYKQQSQIKCIANESMAINLWATIEQYASRSLQVLTKKEVSNSYKWHEIVEKFNAHGFDIKKLSTYESIDEIRVLNNKIKHSYCVDDQLAKFQFFSEYNGKPISSIPLRVKDYTIATYHFIVQLINIIGPSERYPDGEED
ncbi:hypothetical protein HBN76_06510 [Pseudomonas sp. WS 5013]|uniref:hypothetical protein n=1 Tax=Pseudomonas sp. WS 5013 TaxID=2717475 RepID=UPI001475E676|nr:hypothetical protein [Pseudomonas sp. WS 5013]NMY40948.1 hypothetical protein [Pseudomonas sp. WS 5013]